jgi:hypothetical protein
VVLVPVGWSYGQALTGRGTDSVAVRSVEWLRQHVGARIVSFGERWWYCIPSRASVAVRPPSCCVRIWRCRRTWHRWPRRRFPVKACGVRSAGRGLPAVYETAAAVPCAASPVSPKPRSGEAAEGC